MTRRGKAYATGTTIAVLLALIGVAVATKGDDDDDDEGGDDKPDAGDDKGACPPGMKPNPERARALSVLVARNLPPQQLARELASIPVCVPIDCPPGTHRDALTGACVADGNDPAKPPGGIDECPEGYIRNAARLRPLAAGLTGAALEAELAKYPMCVPEKCPPDHQRNEFGECVPSNVDPGTRNCPDGMHWNALTRECVSDCPDGTRWSPVLQRCVDDSPDPDEPVIDPDDIIKDFPEGNAFYQVKLGDILGHGVAGLNTSAVSQNVLGRELFLAAREFGGLDNDAALAWSNARRRNTALTNQIYFAILCAAINDYAYGTWGYCGDVAIAANRCPSTMRNIPGPHGRAIRPLPQHADNRMRLRQGLALARVVAILTPAQKGNGKGNAVAAAHPGGNGSLPMLWIPGVDREHLWQSDGKELRHRSDQANPPAQITNRGVLDYSGSTLTRYGCVRGDFDGEMDV